MDNGTSELPSANPRIFVRSAHEYTDELLKSQAAGQHFFCIGRAAVILKAMVERARALGMKTYHRWKNG